MNEDAAPGGLKGNWDAATNTYTIAQGDYLSKIAKAFGVDWKKMYEENKAKLKSGDPNLVYVGEKVVINGSSVSTNAAAVTTSETSVNPNTTPVKLKYDANALLAYAVERRQSALKPGGDIDNIDKYGKLALYFQDVRDGKAKDIKNYNLTQKDVDDFIVEFEKMIAGDSTKLQQYIEKGKGMTVEMVGSEFQVKSKTPATPGDVNGDGKVDSKDLPPDQTMDNSKPTSGEDLDYDADAEGFEEQEPEMDREIDTTRTLEIKPSDNGWKDFFAKTFGE